jgi:hypothetical protein
MVASKSWTINGATEHTRRFEEYKDTVSRLFPTLPRGYVDTWSISNVDALVLGHFLECYPRKVIVLDIGTFIGVSAFHFASQPEVLRVIGVDPNPTIADEINDKSEVLGRSIDPEPLGNLRVLDVAGAALAEFGEEQQKISLQVGTVGSSQVGVRQESVNSLEKVEIPVPDPSDNASLLAFVDGLHTREGVRADLEAVFDKNPHAVAILDDCRHAWGPFVQAGVVDFMERSEQKYHFRLFGDLGPGLATSKLGVVYPDTDADKTGHSLAELSELFSERLDLLRLLHREEELVGIANEFDRELKQTRAQLEEVKKRNSQLQERSSHLTERDRELKQTRTQLEEVKKRNSQLQERNSQLTTHYSSRRYKLADILTDNALQVPGIRKLAQRKPEQ